MLHFEKQLPKWCGIVLLVLTTWLTSCSKQSDQPAPTEAQTPPPSSTAAPTQTPEPPAPTPAPQASDAASLDQLEQQATQALRDNRMYAPAGNNAIEYYLAIREKQPSAEFVSNALSDLDPYALIAAEQSIQRQDFPEAQRLIGLIEKVDPKAPALPRLKKSLEDSKHQNETKSSAVSNDQATKQEAIAKQNKQKMQAHEAQAAANIAAFQEAERSAEKAAADKKSNVEKAALAKAKAAAQKIAADKATAEKNAAEAAAAAKLPAEKAAKAAEEKAAAEKQKAATQAKSSESGLKALSTPPPRYPERALINGTAGEVTIQFTVKKNGSVTDAKILQTKPNHVFDQAALNAVIHWHFEPVPEPITTTRTLMFKPN